MCAIVGRRRVRRCYSGPLSFVVLLFTIRCIGLTEKKVAFYLQASIRFLYTIIPIAIDGCQRKFWIFFLRQCFVFTNRSSLMNLCTVRGWKYLNRSVFILSCHLVFHVCFLFVLFCLTEQEEEEEVHSLWTLLRYRIFFTHTHFSSFNVFILPEKTDEQSESGDRVVAVFSGNPLSHLGKTRSMATPTSSSDEFCLAWALNGTQTIRVAFIVWDVVVASFFVLCRIRHARFSNGKTIRMSSKNDHSHYAFAVCGWISYRTFSRRLKFNLLLCVE